MLKYKFVMALAMASGGALPAQAAIYQATAANLVSIFNTAQGGDTIVVSGSIGSVALQGRSFLSTVTIDATLASFSDTVTIKDVSRLKVIGGTFGSLTQDTRAGRAVAIYRGRNITFSKSSFIGNGTGVGLSTSGTTNVLVASSIFKGMKTGIGIGSSSRVKLNSNRFNAMTSDGINIADSHFVTASGNRCSGTVASENAHPDCIQLWSVFGNPVQSDIALLRNNVHGATQGLTSFNSQDGGGLRISMIGNTINTSYPQGIACYECSDSTFTDNFLTTLPGSRWRTEMRIVGGTNNIIANNLIGERVPVMEGVDVATLGGFDFADAYEAVPDFFVEDMAMEDFVPGGRFVDDFGFEAGAGLRAGDFGSAGAAVPEPGVWAQLLAGFGLTGLLVRRRTSRQTRRLSPA